ncbi:MAG: type IV pilus modification protein PilV [Gammaproteobacteria bacterium]
MIDMQLQLRLQKYQGFSLIEVLVAVVILAIGLLGLAALQISGLRYTADANMRYQATIQAVDMADRMRANMAGVNNGNYNNISGIGSNPGCISTSCSPSGMAATDAYQWNTTNSQVLPNGTGTVTQNGNLYVITITWIEPTGFGAATQNQNFSMSFTP